MEVVLAGQRQEGDGRAQTGSSKDEAVTGVPKIRNRGDYSGSFDLGFSTAGLGAAKVRSLIRTMQCPAHGSPAPLCLPRAWHRPAHGETQSRMQQDTLGPADRGPGFCSASRGCPEPLCRGPRLLLPSISGISPYSKHTSGQVRTTPNVWLTLPVVLY